MNWSVTTGIFCCSRRKGKLDAKFAKHFYASARVSWHRFSVE